MGGVSEGQVSLEQDGDKVFIRFSGNVRTDNNGGLFNYVPQHNCPIRH